MSFARFVNTLLAAAVLVLFYITWTHSLDMGNIAVISTLSLIIAFSFVRLDRWQGITPRKVIYFLAYTVYMFYAIIVSSFDVARRVVKKNIPINPGIVKVKTKLKSKLGRMILANSITMTPGTLTVEVQDEYYYIHWIDVTARDVESASQEIIAGFEKYLEVIFG